MILHTQPTKPWTKHDFLLLEAYQILQDERCGQCGLPRYICHNDSNLIQFRLAEDECNVRAKVVKKERDDAKRGGKDYEPKPGVQTIPQPYTTDGSDLSSFRESFYEAENKRTTEIMDSLVPKS